LPNNFFLSANCQKKSTDAVFFSGNYGTISRRVKMERAIGYVCWKENQRSAIFIHNYFS
jgi:hypothetical protein